MQAMVNGCGLTFLDIPESPAGYDIPESPAGYDAPESPAGY